MFSVNLLIHALKVAMEDGLTVLIRLKKDSWHYGLTNTEIDNYVARF